MRPQKTLQGYSIVQFLFEEEKDEGKRLELHKIQIIKN